MRRKKKEWKTLQDFELRERETFLYTCGGIDYWEWEIRLLGLEPEKNKDDVPVCCCYRFPLKP